MFKSLNEIWNKLNHKDFLKRLKLLMGTSQF